MSLDPGPQLSMVAAFIAGVSGSLHCLAMCGGITSAMGMRARMVGKTAPNTFWHALLHHAGRLLSYSLAGALCGAFGAALLHVVEMVRMAQWLRILAGVLLMLVGLQLLGWRVLTPLEQFGYRLWQHTTPALQRIKPARSWLQTLLLGAMWGWLPCGLVYSMLLLGVLGASALHGAAVMFAFGLGTLPMLLSSSLITSQLARSSMQWRTLGGIALMIFGMWTAYAATWHPHLHQP